jgi:hypothetical protein
MLLKPRSFPGTQRPEKKYTARSIKRQIKDSFNHTKSFPYVNDVTTNLVKQINKKKTSSLKLYVNKACHYRLISSSLKPYISQKPIGT